MNNAHPVTILREFTDDWTGCLCWEARDNATGEVFTVTEEDCMDVETMDAIDRFNGVRTRQTAALYTLPR